MGLLREQHGAEQHRSPEVVARDPPRDDLRDASDGRHAEVLDPSQDDSKRPDGDEVVPARDLLLVGAASEGLDSLEREPGVDRSVGAVGTKDARPATISALIHPSLQEEGGSDGAEEPGALRAEVEVRGGNGGDRLLPD